MKTNQVIQLLGLADSLDSKGFFEEANQVDQLVIKKKPQKLPANFQRQFNKPLDYENSPQGDYGETIQQLQGI